MLYSKSLKVKIYHVVSYLIISFLLVTCSFELQPKLSCHDQMIALLKESHAETNRSQNNFAPEAKLPYMDSLLNLPHTTYDQARFCNLLKANILLELGREREAIGILEALVKQVKIGEPPRALRTLGVAYLRQAERANCIAKHASESCIMPIQGLGVHSDADGSRKAIEVYKQLLKIDATDLESRWLLNIAYMTLGEYPDNVPSEYLIPNMGGDTTFQVKPFEDIAGNLGLDKKDMAGGSIAEDFDNDGYLDLLTSGWGISEQIYLYQNKTDGTFANMSGKTGLEEIAGGLNMVQADYDNDGWMDVLVLRGAWKREYGKEPNSLLKNNGDGTFTDVTTKAGILSFHPTQTATWNDFNNDGWVDLFIGNESVPGSIAETHPCEMFINNQDGTFRNISISARMDIVNYVKGVTSGDYDNDGWMDIFLSTMDGERKLFRNLGVVGKEIRFENVTVKAGLNKEQGNTFPAWFWDFNNDGLLDIFACDYTFDKSLGFYAAAEKLGLEVPGGSPEKMLLYKNNGDGTFINVATEMGLTTNVFAMGSNFGDIDNDGYLDMYLGSGNPLYQSLVPNKMFKNLDGKKFVEVTASARVGHLQKGHGVSFADMDNDGDQDIHVEMGGAFLGDAYQNSFFLNPGQADNNWICIKLEGKDANRAAIGSRIKVTFKENGVMRRVYRDVNSGGSFGASPLRREIGIGKASDIEEIEIQWHGSNEVQTFHNIKPNQFIKITEGDEKIEYVHLKKIEWILPDRLCYPIKLDAPKLN